MRSNTLSGNFQNYYTSNSRNPKYLSSSSSFLIAVYKCLIYMICKILHTIHFGIGLNMTHVQLDLTFECNIASAEILMLHEFLCRRRIHVTRVSRVMCLCRFSIIALLPQRMKYLSCVKKLLS